jgi:hypothetical protein
MLRGVCVALVTTAIGFGAFASASVAASASELDNETHQRVTPLAAGVLELARTKPPHTFFTLMGAFTSYYEVSVKVFVPHQARVEHLEPQYDFFVFFPRPPGSRKGLVDPRDFAKLRAANAVRIILNFGTGATSFSREFYPPLVKTGVLRPGWVLSAAYGSASGHNTVIVARTRPKRPREQLLTLAKLTAAAAQAQAVIQAAMVDQPTTFLSPAFPRIPGERDTPSYSPF